MFALYRSTHERYRTQRLVVWFRPAHFTVLKSCSAAMTLSHASWQRSSRFYGPSGRIFRATFLLIVAAATFNTMGRVVADDESNDIPAAGSKTDPARVMGLSRADCKKCHPSEVAAWMKSTHFLTSSLRLEKYADNTAKYAKALGVRDDELMTTSVCADCHGTKAVESNEIQVIAGVSCEKCHGGSGGDDGWLNRHQSYHSARAITRSEETEEHRIARIADCESAGMVRSADIDGLVRACYSCHIVSNEKLVAAGHKLASNFEFVSWSEGEVRHNFLMNRDENAASPSLWMAVTGNTPENRRRLKFVVGTLVQLEQGLRARATMSNPALIPQAGGMIAAANGRLMQINAVAATEEVGKASAMVAPMLARLFAPMPDDETFYNDAADEIAAIAETFADQHRGDELAAIDALIKATPPHFSQQFRDKYLPK